jgi:peptidyl-prolyl cis-trans isomerase A (cyclophilin A)
MKVLIESSMGDITLELDGERAPKTVENFLSYVREGFYEGTIFHRVIPDFMIQGGGFTTDGKQKKARAPIRLESGNGLSNMRGTIAMARTSNPDSATSQFFINVVDNTMLDKSPGNPGYTVFGKVIEGMDAVDKIRNAKTGSNGPHGNWPREDITVRKASILD